MGRNEPSVTPRFWLAQAGGGCGIRSGGRDREEQVGEAAGSVSDDTWAVEGPGLRLETGGTGGEAPGKWMALAGRARDRSRHRSAEGGGQPSRGRSGGARRARRPGVT